MRNRYWFKGLNIYLPTSSSHAGQLSGLKQYIIHCIGSTRIPYLRKEREGEGEGGIGRKGRKGEKRREGGEKGGRKGGKRREEGGKGGRKGGKRREEGGKGGKEGQKKVVLFTLAKIVFTNEITIITNITAVLNLMIT